MKHRWHTKGDITFLFVECPHHPEGEVLVGQIGPYGKTAMFQAEVLPSLVHQGYSLGLHRTVEQAQEALLRTAGVKGRAA